MRLVGPSASRQTSRNGQRGSSSILISLSDSKIFGHREEIAPTRWKVIGKVSIRFQSMISGEYVFASRTAMPMKLRSATTINRPRAE